MTAIRSPGCDASRVTDLINAEHERYGDEIQRLGELLALCNLVSAVEDLENDDGRVPAKLWRELQMSAESARIEIRRALRRRAVKEVTQ